jgi:hypothetical protein
MATLNAQVLDIQACLQSKAVLINNNTFPTLIGTTSSRWAVAKFPSAPEKALICFQVVTFLNSILGHEFATMDEMQDTIYQNKQAGVSSMGITVLSSFQMVCPKS